MRRALAFLVWGWAVACSPADSDESAEEDVGAPAAAEVVATSAEAGPPRRAFLPLSMQRATREETFPHVSHVEIDCAVCHEEPAGHASHGAVECAECHAGSASVILDAVTPNECQSCHHGPLQVARCEDCHTGPSPVMSLQTLDLPVWQAPRARSLPFDHAVHVAQDCAACHREQPSLVTDLTCASCHVEHHEPESRCITCHVAAEETAHNLDSHLGCGGAGCHSAPDMDALGLVRSGCLVCHQDQEEHEPAQECAECHQVRVSG